VGGGGSELATVEVEAYMLCPDIDSARPDRGDLYRSALVCRLLAVVSLDMAGKPPTDVFRA
jgi:hypothetical protein